MFKRLKILSKESLDFSKEDEFQWQYRQATSEGHQSL